MPSNSEAQSGRGYLKVMVTAADNALPILGVSVTVTSGTGVSAVLLNKQTTDGAGETVSIELPAPSKELSLSPGNGSTFAKYNVRADFPGYYTVENIDVPVFDGQVSMQPIQMIPLPESDINGKKITILENQNEL